MQASPSADYVSRINRVMDYARKHLDEDLSLEQLAAIAYFSPFHFHRIFKTLTGETLKQFVKRLRLERALYLLSHGPRPLTEVALECGFASSSDFSRSFKAHFGVSATNLDLEAFRTNRREEWTRAVESPQVPALTRLPRGENPDRFEARLVACPARSVRYIRVSKPYEPNRVTDAAARLVHWAVQRGCADGQWLGWTWEDPDLVPIQQCFYDVGVVVPPQTPSEGKVGQLDLPAFTVAEVEVDGSIDLEQRAIDWLFLSWLPESGFVPDHQPTFEAWAGRPFADGLERFRLRIQLPVVQAER